MCVLVSRKIRDKLEKEKEDAERSEHQMMEKHNQIKVLRQSSRVLFTFRGPTLIRS